MKVKHFQTEGKFQVALVTLNKHVFWGQCFEKLLQSGMNNRHAGYKDNNLKAQNIKDE